MEHYTVMAIRGIDSYVERVIRIDRNTKDVRRGKYIIFIYLIIQINNLYTQLILFEVYKYNYGYKTIPNTTC